MPLPDILREAPQLWRASPVPAPPKTICRLTGYRLFRQCQTLWCWAAVMQALRRFLLGSSPSQCRIAEELSAKECDCSSAVGGCPFEDRPRFDGFFTKLRVLLFDDDHPVGSAGLAGTRDGKYTVEHVSLGGVDDLVRGLGEAEQTEDTADREPRLIQLPQVYLSALALVPPTPDRPLIFQIISPPYPEAEGARQRNGFMRFVNDLVDEHRRVFGRPRGH